MPEPDFETSVFVNCPFDEDYEPILQAILFAIVYLGFTPRIATERLNAGENRLEKIVGLIEACRFSIHDLSRCQAQAAGEYYRLNMPFEFGIDYGFLRYGDERQRRKSILVLEERRYRYQAALSDIAGSDIAEHGGDFEKAIRNVRNWLRSEAGMPADTAQGDRIKNAYFDFQEWHYERQLANGASEADIREYPTRELLDAMIEWRDLGKPI